MMKSNLYFIIILLFNHLIHIVTFTESWSLLITSLGLKDLLFLICYFWKSSVHYRREYCLKTKCNELHYYLQQEWCFHGCCTPGVSHVLYDTLPLHGLLFLTFAFQNLYRDQQKNHTNSIFCASLSLKY